MSRYVLNLIVAFFALNIAFDLIGISGSSKESKEPSIDADLDIEGGKLPPSAVILLPFTVAYSVVRFVISYVVLTLFRTLSLISALLRFLGLASANETKAAMLWSLAAVRSLSRGKAGAK